MTRIHLLFLILVNALWGFNFVAGKAGTVVFGPMLFITLRFAIVLVLLAVFLRWVPGQMRRILTIGICMGVGHFSFMFYGIFLAGSLSSVAITSQLTVPFATLLAVIFLGERIRLIRVVAILISFAGVVVIGFAPVGPEHLTAMILTAVASLAMAVSTILIRQLKDVAVFNLQAWIALCATTSMGIITLVLERPQWQHIASIPLIDYWTVTYSAIGATVVGHGLLYYLLKRYSVNSVAPFITLSTLFAIVFGILFTGETLTLKIAIGGGLTLLGVTIIAVRNARENAPSGIRTPR
ncbi:DMT family transporter [Granulosicoccus antarcticus]|uniref:Putative amino-acid metabolite efflux pump n=1 Tax=Granulosicoccus antarcticus IMCC3135 TaxID=1192854 RepID=A0A2Z2NK72_9GAMM|nr:DMT family transporter [Granulosicoccus antarcticus]ASJ70278.1 putative amino-acid metabolite efflux pump [Granulosicoccus antarcticus IMCC3135]